MQIEDKKNAAPAVPDHTKPNRKVRPATIYKRTIRSILQAYELAGYIAGCEEARAQLVEVADLICQKMELMKREARTAKRAGKTGKKMVEAAEAKTEETKA